MTPPEGKRCTLWVRGMRNPFMGVVYYPVGLNYAPDFINGQLVSRGRWMSYGASGSTELLLDGRTHIRLDDIVAWAQYKDGR